jgi:hypothetical protein
LHEVVRPLLRKVRSRDLAAPIVEHFRGFATSGPIDFRRLVLDHDCEAVVYWRRRDDQPTTVAERAAPGRLLHNPPDFFGMVLRGTLLRSLLGTSLELFGIPVADAIAPIEEIMVADDEGVMWFYVRQLMRRAVASGWETEFMYVSSVPAPVLDRIREARGATRLNFLAHAAFPAVRCPGQRPNTRYRRPDADSDEDDGQ